MTLQDFFDILAANPSILLFYFTAVPLTTLLANLFSPGQGHVTPWKELYSILLYLASVPGIFALTLSAYFFLFEQRSLLETDVFVQIMPLLSMILTIYLIKRHVDLDLIPGFDRLSGLFWMIFAIIMLLWLVDRTRIFAIVSLPLLSVVALVTILLIVSRLGWRKVMS